MNAKRWFIAGIVQGVGFRYFVQSRARALNLTGWAKNLDEGLSELAAALHKGPPHSHVRSVEEREAVADSLSDFQVR